MERRVGRLLFYRTLSVTQDIVEESKHGTTEILRGMTAQLAEADDMVVVEDIRSENFWLCTRFSPSCVLLCVLALI